MSHEDYERCPTCGGESMTACRCFRADRTCANGHGWHTCMKHNAVVLVESDHKVPLTCGKNEDGTTAYNCTCTNWDPKAHIEGLRTRFWPKEESDG